MSPSPCWRQIELGLRRRTGTREDCAEAEANGGQRVGFAWIGSLELLSCLAGLQAQRQNPREQRRDIAVERRMAPSIRRRQGVAECAVAIA